MRTKRVGTLSRIFCRHDLLHCVVLTMSFSVASSAFAAFSVNPNPGNFKEIEKAVNINECSEYKGSESIREDLGKAQCGGWDWDDRVYGKIPYVTGLPGRDGDYLGNPESGMAIRYDEGFAAPGDDRAPACGYRSACRPSDWYDPDEYIQNPRFYPPFYKAFPCQRPLGGITPLNQPDPEDPNDPKRSRGQIEFSCGGAEMPTSGYVCPGLSPDNSYSPLLEAGTDGGLCGWLNNRWLYGYYQQEAPVDYACDDARITEKPILCRITLYSGEGPCREQWADEVWQNDIDEGAVPKDPTGMQMAPYSARQCCTYQDVGGTQIYGPDGPGDASGDNVDYLNSCITCSNEQCRYIISDSPNIPAPDRPRYQYYPPWLHEIYSPGCSYCVDTRDSETIVSCDDEYASEPIYPCEKYLREEGGIKFVRRTVGLLYRSFFRHYLGSYDRAQVRAVPTDDHQKTNIPVSCYSIYIERDYKSTVASPYTKSCVIAAYYREPSRNFWEMGRNATRTRNEKGEIVGTQEGTGSILSDMDDITSLVRRTPYDEDTDLWDPRLSNTLSLTNKKVAGENYDNDISLVLYQPADTTHLNSTVQLFYTEKDLPGTKPEQRIRLLSSGALLRAFDDTVSKERGDQRTVAEWWQEQETMSHLLMRPPVIHLLLPPAWSVGLDPVDPIFLPKVADEDIEEKDPRMRPIEFQLHAEEDLIDTIKAFLKETLLPQIVEERIPLIVPLGSPAEFRALAESWEEWVLAAPKRGDIYGVYEAKNMMLALEQYAHQIEEVRKLRGEILKLNTNLLESQTTITNAIGTWLNRDVVGEYEAFRRQLEEIENLQAIWGATQTMYRRLHDHTAMPWCHNDRFTVPIYSLLDTWLPGRPALDGGDWRDPSDWSTYESLPALDIERGFDASFDFTALKLASGLLAMPVLDPVEVHISFDKVRAPEPFQKRDPKDIPTLPGLPPIPTIDDISRNLVFFPATQVKSGPPGISFTTWSDGELADISEDLSAIRGVIARMSSAYGKFWDSQTGFSYDNPPDPPRSEQDCYARDSRECVHTEMDLLERLMRFGTRPAVLLRDDFLSIGDFRVNPAQGDESGTGGGYGLESCPREDWACQILHGRKEYPQTGWAINWSRDEAPESSSALRSCGGEGNLIEQLRTCYYKKTLERPDVEVGKEEPSELLETGLWPYDALRREIVPSFEIPEDIPLLATPPNQE